MRMSSELLAGLLRHKHMLGVAQAMHWESLGVWRYSMESKGVAFYSPFLDIRCFSYLHMDYDIWMYLDAITVKIH